MSTALRLQRFQLHHVMILLSTLCGAGAVFRVWPVAGIVLAYLVVWGLAGFSLEGDAASVWLYGLIGAMLLFFPVMFGGFLVVVGIPFWAAVPVTGSALGAFIGAANRGSRGALLGVVVGAVLALAFIGAVIAAISLAEFS